MEKKKIIILLKDFVNDIKHLESIPSSHIEEVYDRFAEVIMNLDKNPIIKMDLKEVLSQENWEKFFRSEKGQKLTAEMFREYIEKNKSEWDALWVKPEIKFDGENSKQKWNGLKYTVR